MISIFKKGKSYLTGGTGDGTRNTPYYWFVKTNNELITGLDNSNADRNDDCRVYLRIKLKAGTTYTIAMTAPGGYDGKIYLYDENWKQLTSGDDTGDGDSETLDDCVTYTPSADGIFYIGAGNYSYDEGSGLFKVRCYPVPEYEAPPAVATIYETSSGFDEFGYPVRFDTAMEAGCNFSVIPEDGLVFYASLKEDRATAETGQALTKSGTPVYETVDGVPCAYFNLGAGFTTPAIDVADFPDGFTFSVWAKRQSGNQLLNRRNGTYSCQYAFTAYSTSIDIWAANGSTSNPYVTFDQPKNKIYHAVVRCKDGVFEFFADGEFIGSASGTLGTKNSGDTRIALDYYPNEAFVGHLAALRIYNRVLTDSEIKALSKEFKVS